jgi:DNA-binding MarR family transcriptional regulator
MANGVSVPIRVEATLPGLPILSQHGRERTAILDLVAFAAGDEPRIESEQPIGEPLGALARAPRQAWGMDEAGVEADFPLSEAFAKARDDADFSGVRDLLARSPDAYVGLALSYSSGVGADHGTGWIMTITDGKDAVMVSVDKDTQPGAAGQPFPLGYFLPAGFPVTTTTYSVTGQDTMPVPHGMFPEPSALPATLPTVAAVMDRWQVYASPGQDGKQANSWGIALLCGNANCSEAAGEVLAGRTESNITFVRTAPTTAIPIITADGKVEYSMFAARLDDSAAALVDATVVGSVKTDVAPAHQIVPLRNTPAPPSPPGAALAGLIPSAGTAASVGLLATLAALVYLVWPSLKGGSLVGLFSRLQGPQLLAHPSRARLMEIIQAEPGIHFQDLVRRSGLPNGTAVHHVRKLEQGGFVAVRPLGRYTCYFPGTPDRASLAAAPVTKSDGARRILAEVAASPGLSGSELAVRLGLQPSTVAYHVKRLEQAGLLASVRDGRSVRLRTSASAV